MLKLWNSVGHQWTVLFISLFVKLFSIFIVVFQSTPLRASHKPSYEQRQLSAVKIQSTYRGYASRKKTKNIRLVWWVWSLVLHCIKLLKNQSFVCFVGHSVFSNERIPAYILLNLRCSWGSVQLIPYKMPW